MEKKPHFKGILDVMDTVLGEILDSSYELKNLKLVGSILEDYDLPKKKKDVYFIVDRLEKMVKSCIRVERLGNAQEYLTDLVEKIRVIFFKTLLVDFFIDRKDVKIILNDGTELVIVASSLSMMADPITGRTSDKKDVKIYFRDIKFKDGISAV
ncbi:MAG: hypothetical protein KAQ63_00520 [Candidatus Moranbacteria bacterium]|nr:hypothetical protein [Candidatus Moranbacteria bacterium]